MTLKEENLSSAEVDFGREKGAAMIRARTFSPRHKSQTVTAGVSAEDGLDYCPTPLNLSPMSPL